MGNSYVSFPDGDFSFGYFLLGKDPSKEMFGVVVSNIARTKYVPFPSGN